MPMALAPSDAFFDAPQLSHSPGGRGQVMLESSYLALSDSEICHPHALRYAARDVCGLQTVECALCSAEGISMHVR